MGQPRQQECALTYRHTRTLARACIERAERAAYSVCPTVSPGEATHAVGRDGAIRAKQWLDATTRVDVTWINPDAVEKLTFTWADGSTFSFDLGGTLRGGDWHGEEFFAEVKKYSAAQDQGQLYSEYLAKCYRAF